MWKANKLTKELVQSELAEPEVPLARFSSMPWADSDERQLKER
jgi:hypothetical protein